MGNNSKFKDSSFNNTVTTEKVSYQGELRIIGKIVEYQNSSDILGYLIMTERTQKFKMYTVSQTKNLLSKFKFVNAKLQDDKVINTECSMNRMPEFNTFMQPFSNKAIIVLGEIISSNKNKGYRVLSPEGKVVDISEDELIALNSANYDIINAKIVNRNNKQIVSAIKGEFTKIEKVGAEIKKESRASQLRKERHLEKLLTQFMPKAVKCYVSGSGAAFNTYIYTHSDSIYHLDLNRETKIILSEIYNKGLVKLTNKDKELIKKVVKMPHASIVGYGKGNTEESQLYFFALCQFILNDDDMYRRLLKQTKKLNKYRLTQIENNKIASDKLKEFIKEIKARQDKKEREAKYGKESKYGKFETTTFKSGVDCAQLGFAISKENDGMEYVTKTNNKKTLKFIGKYIPYYDEYKKDTRCLGDLLAIANIEIIKGKLEEGSRLYEPAEYKAAIEMIIAISYLYGSKVMKKYIDNYGNELKLMGIEVPDFDELSKTDYKLSSDISIYYASGFNVFLNDSEDNTRKYRYEHLKSAQYINYRQLGNKHSIEHQMLKGELASVIQMVTSSNCDAIIVDKMIGKLRFL